MANYNTSATTAAQSTNGIYDYSGVPVVSSGNTFGDSPLGVAARSQAIYGIANAQFNLLPNNTAAELVDSENPLPYWTIGNYSGGRIVPKSFFDTTTGTWSVELNPTAGSSADYLELKTRSYLLTDDNLALRQKAYLTMSKGTAYAGSTQFNVVLSAEYFDVNGTSLSSYSIGTALDNTAMTSISGITTSGSAAINAAAAYVDFTIKLSVTATVTSGVKVYLKSFFIQTSQAATGSFLITETFTSSGTFNVPTGVNYVTVMALGAGGGGAGGRVTASNGTSATAADAGGGRQAYWALRRDIYVGGSGGSVSVGIGAGGTGGTATALNKAAAATTTLTATPTTPGNASATTFGTFLSVPGPQGLTAGDVPTGVYGTDSVAPPASPGTHSISTYVQAPFTTFGTVSNPGTAGSGSGGGNGASGAAGAAAAGTGIAGGGGNGGGGTASAASSAGAGSAGFVAGSGGGGGAAARYINATQTVVVTGGNGGNAVANTGGGGGAGGAACVAASTSANYNASTITLTSGKGGNGATGIVVVAYVA